MSHPSRPRSQQTLRRPAVVAGRGYWSGRETSVEILPAPAGAGVVFVRGDLDPAVRVAATLDNRVDAVNRTNLVSATARLEMV